MVGMPVYMEKQHNCNNFFVILGNVCYFTLNNIHSTVLYEGHPKFLRNAAIDTEQLKHCL